MKIAILTPTLDHFSGIDRLVEANAKDYVKKGNEVTIFTLRASIQLPKIKVTVMGMPKNPLLERIYRLFFFLDFMKIRKYTKMMKDYDVVISHLYPMNIIASRAKRLYSKKYIYYNAGVGYANLFDKFSERLYLKLFKIFTDRTIKNADEVISISNFLRRELKAEIGIDSRVEYVPVDKKRFKKGNGERIRKKFNLGKDPVLLYVGRVSPHKGIHTLIDVLCIVKKEIPNAKLLVVGKHTFPQYTKQLERLSRKCNDSVNFAGFVEDSELPDYYAASNVYVTASLWEGFDIPCVEAQYAGKKVVAFDICSHPEVVKNGFLIKPKDINGFAEAVVKILKKRIS